MKTAVQYLLVHLTAFGGYRAVYINDDLGIGVDLLDLFDEGDVLVDLLHHLFGRVGRRSQYEGIFGDDIEFPDPFREGLDAGGGLCAPLVHFLQDLVVAGLGAEEDHLASAFTHQCQGFIRIFIDGIDAAFAPPGHIFFLDEPGEFNRTFFRNEEIIVVKLDGVAAKVFLQVFDVVVDELCRLSLPAGIVYRYHGAE